MGAEKDMFKMTGPGTGENMMVEGDLFLTLRSANSGSPSAKVSDRVSEVQGYLVLFRSIDIHSSKLLYDFHSSQLFFIFLRPLTVY